MLRPSTSSDFKSHSRSSHVNLREIAKSQKDSNLCATVDIPIIYSNQIDNLNSWRIGEGTYGHVRKYRYKKSPDLQWEDVAIKYASSAVHQRNLVREAKILLNINHPNCIRIYGFYECQKNGMGVVMEYMDCNLEYLLSMENIEYKIEHAISWMYQLSNAVHYFHSHGQVHRDLKLQNLLLCNQFHTLKVCDFGTFTSINVSMTANRGTPVTMAPEIIKGHKNYTSKCDIYSIGIIMWQIIARKEPYNLCSQQDGIALIWNVAARDKRPPNLSCNIILSRFYERCWHSDPDKRPTSEEVKEYFTILSKVYPNSEQPLLDRLTNKPAVMSQSPKGGPLRARGRHIRGGSDQSTLIKTSEVTPVRTVLREEEIDIRPTRSHSMVTEMASPHSDRAHTSPEISGNVLDYIDRSLRPVSPIIGDLASEQKFNEHIAMCHQLHYLNISAKWQLAKKHETTIRLAQLEKSRQLLEHKRKLIEIRDEALKRIQQNS